MSNSANKSLASWALAAAALGLLGGAGFAHLQTATPNASLAVKAPADPSAQAATPAAQSSGHAALAIGSASAAYRQAWELSRLLTPPTASKPVAPSIWRIAGTTSVNNEQRVLVVFEGSNVPELKKVGDSLPGGAKITEIRNDAIQVEVNKQRMYILTGQP